MSNITARLLALENRHLLVDRGGRYEIHSVDAGESAGANCGEHANCHVESTPVPTTTEVRQLILHSSTVAALD